MTEYEQVKATLDSPGMKLIVRELRKTHKSVYKKYRSCGSMDELLNLQTLQKVIDTELPRVLEKLMNRHLEEEKNKKTVAAEWWHFSKWFEKFTR